MHHDRAARLAIGYQLSSTIGIGYWLLPSNRVGEIPGLASQPAPNGGQRRSTAVNGTFNFKKMIISPFTLSHHARVLHAPAAEDHASYRPRGYWLLAINHQLSTINSPRRSTAVNGSQRHHN